jgi:uncharacterized protein (TIGR03086 family)
MSEISERYARRADAFAAKVAGVADDQWSAPTPCPDWTARDLVRHVVTTQGIFLGFIDRGLDGIPSVDDDPVAAWDAARALVQRELDDPDRATLEFEGFMGTQTFEAGVDQFLSFDLIVHGWDLARATGQDDHIDGADVERTRTQAEAFADKMRGPNAFGPEVEPPAGAGPQEKLLAFLGREP